MDYQLGPGPLQVDQNTTDEKIKGDIGIVENGDIATHAILKDYYVIWKGNLYKAKTDISSGTTLSAESNGNLDLKSNGLGGEVAALNSNINTLLTTRFYTKSIDNLSANTDFSVTIPIELSGYTPLAVRTINFGGNYASWVHCHSIAFTNNTVTIGYRINSSSSVAGTNNTINVSIIYIKT